MAQLVNGSGVIVFEGRIVGGGGGGIGWVRAVQLDFATLNPQSGAIFDVAVLAATAWLGDVSAFATVGVVPFNNGTRFSACGWDLAGNAGGPYYLNDDMPVNAGSWADLGQPKPQDVPSLVNVSPLFSTSVNENPGPLVYTGKIPAPVGQLTPDATLPLQVLFADGAPVTYTAGTVEVWLLVQA